MSTLDSHVGKHPKVLKLLHGSHFISFLKTRHPSCGFPACALHRPIKKHQQVSSGILIPADKQKPSRAEFFVGSCLSDAASVRFPLASTAMLGDFNRTDGGQFACLRNAGIGPLFASQRGTETAKPRCGFSRASRPLQQQRDLKKISERTPVCLELVVVHQQSSGC